MDFTSSVGRVVARQLCMHVLPRARRGCWFFHRLSALDARWRTPKRPPAARRPMQSHAQIDSSLTSDGQQATPAFILLARDRIQLAVVGCRLDGPKSTPRAGADASETGSPTEGVENLLLLICAIRSAELEHYVESYPAGNKRGASLRSGICARRGSLPISPFRTSSFARTALAFTRSVTRLARDPDLRMPPHNEHSNDYVELGGKALAPQHIWWILLAVSPARI